MNISKPNRSTVSPGNGLGLLDVLLGFYDSIQELARPLLPSRVPNLKSVTLSTFADLRRTPGDALGELGPRVTLLAGGVSVFDSGAGTFVWDPTSVLTDDGVGTFQVSGLAVGRWRKLTSSGGVTDGDKGDVIVTGGGTVWTLDPAVRPNVVEATVDFGADSDAATVTVTGQPWVTATSKIVAQVFGSTADHDAEDALLEQLHVTVANRVAGTGFDVLAHAPEGTFGQYLVHCVGVA